MRSGFDPSNILTVERTVLVYRYTLSAYGTLKDPRDAVLGF